MPTNRINFLDLNFDSLTFQNVRERLQRVTPTSRYGYVVTPNVDHLVRLHREPALSELYEHAALCLCDSRVLRLLARLRGIQLPLVAGSDLAGALFADVIKSGDKIAIVGGSEGFLGDLRSRFPGIEFVHHAPPMGLRDDPAARGAAARFVCTSKARFAFIAVGSPQQEQIAHEVGLQQDASGVALCIGAGLEFLTGAQRRAPRWARSLGLEWAHRLATNPRRLWRRYLVDGMRIFPIYLRWRGATRWPIWVGGVLLFSGLTAAGMYAAKSYTQRPTFGAAQQRASLQPDRSAAISLPPPNLLRPLSPDEAAKENAERPFVDRPDTSASKFVLRTDSTDRERALTCLTQAVYYEAAGEGADGGRAVAQVVLNRMHHPGYPASVCGVIYQGSGRPTGCQFTFTCDGSLLRQPVASLWDRSRKIAEEALNGHVFAPIGHATHYHADYVLPYWADSLDKTIQIGRHIFYRLRSSLGDSRSFFQRYAGAEPELPKPGSTLVVAASEDTEKLASALISDATPGLSQQVEKAAPKPASPLLVDSVSGTLLADSQAARPVETSRPKAEAECAAVGDRKRLSPLGANDMRAPTGSSSC
jgi:exopolysaccharide biosynthesis WecB/TagA/CpsF family protein